MSDDDEDSKIIPPLAQEHLQHRFTASWATDLRAAAVAEVGFPSLKRHLAVRAARGDGDAIVSRSMGGQGMDLPGAVAILVDKLGFMVVEDTAAGHYRNIVLTNHDTVIALESNGDHRGGFQVSGSAPTVTRVHELVGPLLTPFEKKGEIHALLPTMGGGLDFHSVGKVDVPFEPGNYTEDVAEAFPKLCDQLEMKDPPGRILLLDGEPGSGKTFLIRSLAGRVKAKVAIIQATMMQSMDAPGLISALRNLHEDGEPLVLILEDADSCLVRRAGDNMSMLSALLNLSDGILGHLLDVRIVATTNAPVTDIDPAVMRAGRLLDRLAVGPLPPDRAKAAMLRLKPEATDVDFAGPVTIGDVYAMVKGQLKAPKKAKRVGFA